MQVVADLHLHSRYSRAVSQQMILEKMWEWGKKKGIGLLATGDWTHPLWFREVKNLLIEEDGLFRLKDKKDGPLFLLSTEISSIYTQGGKLRRIHNIIFAPSIATAEKINRKFLTQGVNLSSDGRPITGLTASEVLKIALDIDSNSLIIPAHIWTPHFSLYGSRSGFDSIGECFGTYAQYIYAVETGLSSDPSMNWRIAELDNRSIVSFSDAHSGPKLGREATVFKTKDQRPKTKDINFGEIVRALKQDTTGDWEVGYTIEFHPEEGKYHYTGHRNCGVKQSPEETKKEGEICPVCGKKLTIGVMHRVEELAKRPEERMEKIENGIRWVCFPPRKRPPYVSLVPFLEIIAEANGFSVTSPSVLSEYERLVAELQGELKILMETPLSEIKKAGGERLAEGIDKVRKGEIVVDPGYDGVYGIVKIWGKKTETRQKQLGLFSS